MEDNEHRGSRALDQYLEHGFHDVNYLPWSDRVRFTISDRARLEVLRRLSELNHQRYEEEVIQGLHVKAAMQSLSSSPRTGRKTSSFPDQLSSDLDSRPVHASSGVIPAAILGFLSAHEGWHAKAAILSATSITGGQWNAAITDLIASGRVERQGERRGTRYRFHDEGE